MAEEDQEPSPGFGETIVHFSKDRKEVTFLLGGEEYTATKPRKSDEWFAELQMALSSGKTGRILLEVDRFFNKIVGEDVYDGIRERRLDDDDDLSWEDMSQVMYDVFELWSSEPDQPVRPTGPRSASSRGKRTTTRR